MTVPPPRARRIFYAGDLRTDGTCYQRFESMRRLKQEVLAFSVESYAFHAGALNALRDRYPFGPFISKMNREFLKQLASFRPDLVWFDKPLFFTRDTMRAIKRSNAQIAFYVQDAPFGPRKDGCWKQFMKVYRIADLHCLVREADATRYRALALPFIRSMFSFNPKAHYPRKSGFDDAQSDREISYIGHPHEERPAFLLELARKHQLPISVNGNRWQRALSADELQYFRLGGYLSDAQYREGIWRSKINLSFVTRDNEDDIAHKSVEIAACGGFLMALRTPGHQAIFEEDHEAVFFSSVEECADKCKFYLPRAELREAIAARGRERAVRCGYDNDTQLARALNRLDGREETATP